MTLKKKSYYANGTLATIFNKIEIFSYLVKILTLCSKKNCFKKNHYIRPQFRDLSEHSSWKLGLSAFRNCAQFFRAPTFASLHPPAQCGLFKRIVCADHNNKRVPEYVKWPSLQSGYSNKKALQTQNDVSMEVEHFASS